MAEETESTTTEQQAPQDDELEVKWRKKTTTSPPPSENAAPPAEDVATLRQDLEQERQRTQELQDKWHRAAADLANLRRRTEQERGEVEKFSNMLLVQEILPVLDNFERAIATIPGDLSMLTWIHGVMLIERHMQAILERQGLEPIVAGGQQFDPRLHEAIAEIETADQAPGTVVREYQKGYTMHGRVIRPTLVEIAKAPQPAEEPEAPAPEETDQAQAEAIAQEADTENVGP